MIARPLARWFCAAVAVVAFLAALAVAAASDGRPYQCRTAPTLCSPDATAGP